MRTDPLRLLAFVALAAGLLAGGASIALAWAGFAVLALDGATTLVGTYWDAGLALSFAAAPLLVGGLALRLIAGARRAAPAA